MPKIKDVKLPDVKVMKYVLELYFKEEPNCNNCMLSRYTGSIYLGCEISIGCAGMAGMPNCVKEGYRRDCPLKLSPSILDKE